jgi:hypothetical protein
VEEPSKTISIYAKVREKRSFRIHNWSVKGAIPSFLLPIDLSLPRLLSASDQIVFLSLSLISPRHALKSSRSVLYVFMYGTPFIYSFN